MDLLSKVFNDPVHGHIKLHPLCVKIIDTPQFQRLRNIKQLDSVYYVYPAAAHNRFEHSIGVCHLAEKFVRELKDRQPELGIQEKDVLCVSIAGLCHDLGHGPFSHIFERFIAKMLPDKKWKHAEASVAMFDHLIEKNNLRKEFSDHDLYDADLQFIREQLSGKVGDHPGRDEGKKYLYEIVNNKRNGIDVDKWDYFARDCLMLGIGNTFDRNRCMQLARVIKVDGVKLICFREKEADHIYDMFYQRAKLLRQAYQHKTTYIIGAMIIEALEKANEFIKFGEKKMSEAIDDMDAFTQLTDEVLQRITYSEDPELDASKDILMKIMCRRLYKFVAEKHPYHPTYRYIIGNERVLAREIANDQPDISENDIVIQIVQLDLGSENKNPLENVLFYSKRCPNDAFPIQDPIFQAKRNLELIIRVFSKKPCDEIFNKKVKEAFDLRMDDKAFLRRILPPVEVEDVHNI